MAMSFSKAKKEKIWAKILLGGPSGSGKTYTALRLATGIASQCNSKVAAIDTENGRIKYYANEFDYYDLQLEEPYTPEKYIEAIDTAVSAGYKVLIVDSISHEWTYCNEIHNKMPGNSWANWARITPRHDAFMEKLLQSPIHIIATVRGKDAYVQEEKDGKKTIVKQGVGYTQRDNVEYNYTCTFNLSQDTHIASVMKDNTHIFEGRYDILTEADGVKIYNWANSGESFAKPKEKIEKPKAESPDTAELADKKSEISSLAKSLADSGTSKVDIANAVKKHFVVNGKPSANFNAIEDVSIADMVIQELKGLSESK